MGRDKRALATASWLSGGLVQENRLVPAFLFFAPFLLLPMWAVLWTGASFFQLCSVPFHPTPPHPTPSFRLRTVYTSQTTAATTACIYPLILPLACAWLFQWKSLWWFLNLLEWGVWGGEGVDPVQPKIAMMLSFYFFWCGIVMSPSYFVYPGAVITECENNSRGKRTQESKVISVVYVDVILFVRRPRRLRRG